MTSSATADVIVIGGGVIGLASARACAQRGLSVRIAMPDLAGAASSAAAGVLGPTIETPLGMARDLGCRSRDMYPAFCAALAEETGIDAHLSLTGVLRLAASDEEAAALRAETMTGAHWLSRQDVHRLEPELSGDIVGALFHATDGMVANERLHAALRATVRSHARIRWSMQPVTSLSAQGERVGVRLANGDAWEGRCLVLAAGAWTPGLEGLPNGLSVEPVRGQMVSLRAPGITHPAYGFGGYLVPRRDGRIWVGSTYERVGFQTQTSGREVARLQALGHRLAPVAVGAPIEASWAGLRPFTPDGLPILGRDADHAGLVYACGHSRNGILLAPLTGEVVAALAAGSEPHCAIDVYSPMRFGLGRADR